MALIGIAMRGYSWPGLNPAGEQADGAIVSPRASFLVGSNSMLAVYRRATSKHYRACP